MSKVADAAKVKAKVDEVKAKMADTSQQYVPVAKADDPWTTWEAAPVQTVEQAVETVKAVLGGTAPEETCTHGARVWKTGISKAGKPWGMWKCNPPHGTSNYCNPIWYSIAADGSWKPRSE
jgi:predicted metalloendopeptidase